MHRHQADGVRRIVRGQRDYASGLAKVCQVLNQMIQVSRLMDGLRLPGGDEVEHRLNDRRTAIELESPGDDGQGIAAGGFAGLLFGTVRRAALDLVARRTNHFEHGGTARDAIQHGGQRSGTAIAFLLSLLSTLPRTFHVSPIPRQRSHRRPELNRINVELRQRRGAKQTDVVSDGRYRTQAGEEITHLGRVGDIEIFDGERNLRLGEFANYVVTMGVGTVQNSEVFPLAAQFPLYLGDHAGHVGTLGFLDSKGNSRNWRAQQSFLLLRGFLFARGLQRLAAVGRRGMTLFGETWFSEDRRILVDQRKGAAKDGGGGPPIFLQDNPLGSREMTMKQFKGRAGRAAKTVDGLIGIADGEQVCLRAGKRGENFYLGEVRILEFVDQNETGLCAFRGEQAGVGLQQGVGARDHVAERSQAIFFQPAFHRFKHAGDFAASAKHLGIVQLVFRLGDPRDGQLAALQPGYILRIFFRSDQLVVAAAEKAEQIAQKLADIGGTNKMLQMQLGDATAQIDPQVNVIENAKILASSFQQIETTIMKRGGTNSLADQGAHPLAH